MPYKRIAVITNFLYRFGGAERVFFNIIQHLINKGHTVDLYAFGGTYDSINHTALKMINRIHIENSGQIEVRSYPKYKFFMYPLNNILSLDLNRAIKVAKKIASICNTRNYDIIYMNQAHITPLVAPYLNNRSHIGIYIHEPPRHIYDRHLRSEIDRIRDVVTKSHGFDAVLKRMNRVARAIDYSRWREAYNYAMEYIDTVFVNSRYTAGCVKRAYNYKGEVVVAYPGVDHKTFYPIPDIKQKNNIALNVGPLQVHKMHHFAIEAIGTIDANLRPVLRIIGTGEEIITKDVLVELAEKWDVNVDIIDHAHGDNNLNSEYNRATVVLHPNLYEPFGLVTVEAMAAGRCVVAIDEGGISELIKDASCKGYGTIALTTLRNKEKFGNAIANAIANKELRAEIGINARKYIMENLTWQRLYAKIDSWINNGR